MADITLKLIWYRLGEVSEKMAETGRSWYTELDFDSYVLDLLLLGWCTLCLLIILVVNAIVSAFGPLQRRPREKNRGDTEGESLTGAVLPIETAKWFNDAVNWFYLHYYYSAPEYIVEWLKSLNEQLIKLGGPVQAKFDRIQSGSLPPRITHVSSEASPQDMFIIHAKLESRDLSFVVFASQQTHEGVKLTNVTASVLRLKGTLKVQSYREGADVKVSFNFEGKPEIKVDIKPINTYQDTSELVDLGVLEAIIRNSIIMSKTTFTVTHLLMPGDLQTMEHDFGVRSLGHEERKGSNIQNTHIQSRDKLQKQTAGSLSTAPLQSVQQKQQEQVDQEIQVAAIAPTTNTAPPIHSISVQNEPVQSIAVHPVNNRLQLQQQQQQQLQKQIQQVPRRDQQKVRPQARPEAVFEPVETAQQNSSLMSTPLKPPRMIGDKRLLVKVIKANGLTLREVGGANCACMLSTDEPIQGYSTSVVKNTQNPFWDEHFLFDITHDTQEVRVEVYDKNKIEDQFIGEAIVYIEDLRKTPSSRQILRLHPQPGNFEYNSGSVTAEFLFMDPSEADLLLDSMTTTANNQLSPRRRIEVARSVTPSGTVVTKTTTTTQRPQYGRHDPGLDGVKEQQIPTIESSATYDTTEAYVTNQEQPTTVKDKKKGGFGSAILKRFGRKKRAQSADRAASSVREGDYLRPPEPTYGPQSKDDLELVRPQSKNSMASPNLKKSRTLGGSLKKLFRRSRKQSKSRGDSRESSLSRGSRSKGPSRDNSLSRQSQREYEQREPSIS
uniref:C2 domain-containing protein n=1 Tax=Arion vulgaris TaxID=1028688 RepID=A0A0B7BHJ9_9EUPU